MTILSTKDPVDWPSVWADLLRGVGRGLLHYDGSRLAQAALMGLDIFDEAQAQRKSQETETGAEDRQHEIEVPPLPDMSAAELAEFQRLSPEDQDAFRHEAAESGLPADLRIHEYRPLPGNGHYNYGDSGFPTVARPIRRWPLSPSPFAGWPLEAVLPFAQDGRLNVPTLRR